MKASYYWFVVLCFQVLRMCYSDCRFPDFLVNNTWYIHYQNNKEVNITVQSTRMSITECKTNMYRSCRHYERNCNVAKGDNTFLVREILGDSSSYELDATYRCMQFIRRGNSVVQTRISRFLSRSSSNNLCDPVNLILDKNPMISRTHAEHADEQCPLIGGFDFKLYRPGEPGPLCDDIFLPLRIESDCTMNEGIKLYFRRRNCSSLFLGRPIENDPVRLQCVATWSHMHYTYSMVKWHGSSEFWCVRVTYRHERVKEINIYFSGICPTDNEAYDRMLILKHFKVHYVTNICEDENLVCSYHHCSTHVRDNCKLSCSLCEPEKEERSCSFPREFQGYWNSLQDPLKSALIIDNGTLIQQHQKWHCVTSTTSEMLRRRKVLKLKFDNGCHPRYMCIDIEQPAESVLRYRTGVELHWPIEFLEEVCEDRYFDYIPGDIDNKGIARTSGPWIYFINDAPKYVSCNLPWYIPKTSFYDMYDKDSRHSNSGCLMNKNGGEGRILDLHYARRNTQQQWIVYWKKTFVCLASIRFIGENDVLITKNEEENMYMCWSFYRDGERNYVYIYGAKDCGNGTNMQLVHHSAKKALALLVLKKNSTECDFIEHGQKVMTRRSDDTLSNLTENNTRAVSSANGPFANSLWMLALLFVYHAMVF